MDSLEGIHVIGSPRGDAPTDVGMVVLVVELESGVNIVRATEPWHMLFSDFYKVVERGFVDACEAAHLVERNIFGTKEILNLFSAHTCLQGL
jgi:hypothetical protein